MRQSQDQHGARPELIPSAYADQNERDYGAMRDAVDTGRITAQEGV
jgi:hypothetical protein